MDPYVATLPVRWSHLRNIGRSPLHYRYFLDHPIPETAAMRIGAFVHQKILGGPRRFEVYDGDRRGKAWDEFSEAYGSLATILNRGEGEQARAIVEAIQASPEALAILESGEREVPISWTQAGRECQGTPDVLSDTVLAELKVTASADPRALRWHVLKMGWHAQIAWYMNGATRSMRPMPADCYIVAAESRPPYPVTILHLERSALFGGEAIWMSYFETLRQCEASDTWPAYSSCPVPFEAPTEEGLIFAEEEEAA